MRNRASASVSVFGSLEPLSPRVVINTWTAAPASDHAASVPPAEISGSSGCAYTASADAGTSRSSIVTVECVEDLDDAGDVVVVDVLVGHESHRARVEHPADDALAFELGENAVGQRV